MTAALQYFEWCCLCCWSNLETLAWKCFCIFKIIGLCVFLNVEVTFNIVLNMHLHLLLYMNFTKIIPHYLVILKTFRKKKNHPCLLPPFYFFILLTSISLQKLWVLSFSGWRKVITMIASQGLVGFVQQFCGLLVMFLQFQQQLLQVKEVAREDSSCSGGSSS